MPRELIYKDEARRAILQTNSTFAYCINNIKPVDAVEVVHASWIEDGYYGNPFVCSHCGSEGCYYGDFNNKKYYYTNYCPHCGAKMDGGNEDGK